MRPTRSDCRLRYLAACLCGLMLLQGCAALTPNYEMPGVSVGYIKPLSADGVSLGFEIGLWVTNPNDAALELEGASYSVKLDDYEILTGVSNELPVIDGYAQAEIVINARADLVRSMQFARSLTTNPRDSFAYEFNLKLSTDNLFAPIYVTDTGTMNFQF